MFKWLKKRLGLEPQPIDPDFGTRLGKAMGPITTDKIEAGRITASFGKIDVSAEQIVIPKASIIGESKPIDSSDSERITATEIKAANAAMLQSFPIVDPAVILVKASELEKLVDEAEEIVDMMFRGAEMAPCRRAAKEHADNMQEFVDKLRKHRIFYVLEK